ncbi:mannosyl-3-phosphoglycerate phosphatase [Alteromonadaceae bacterium Bs31]|nr:mannosyl-3-phosphoglycerate phosphatase [Alteromonadaceae bacterium Bs31]
MLKPQQASYIISTDLDGTLLDHFSYKWDAAKPSLDKLTTLAIPVIINTSKTFEEVLLLQEDMSIFQPFVVENGSGAYFPKSQYPEQPPGSEARGDHWQITLGCPRKEIVNFLQRLRKEKKWDFQGFSDMSLDDVISLTGLAAENAKLALLRSFSEPLIWHDSEENYQAFVKRVEEQNLRVIKGGRFIHILGQTDKGKAIIWCKNYLQTLSKQAASLIALGDSPNDIDMLNIADFPVLIKSPTHDYPEISSGSNIIKTKGFGPVGWHEAIEQLIFS